MKYLLTDWIEDVALRFAEVLDHKIIRLKQHPYIGIIFLVDGHIRSISITKHNRLFYRLLTEHIIEIVNIFGTRHNPLRNKFE